MLLKEKPDTFFMDCHNKDIESDIHSTDNHGYSDVIFEVCNSLVILFAPRIKNYYDQIL